MWTRHLSASLCEECQPLMSSINHPIGVANILSSNGVTDVKVLQAALLHDTIEDTPTTLGISKLF